MISWKYVLLVFLGMLLGGILARCLFPLLPRSPKPQDCMQVVALDEVISEVCPCPMPVAPLWTPESALAQWLSECPGFASFAGEALFGWRPFDDFVEGCMAVSGGRDHVCTQVLGVSTSVCRDWAREEP